MNSCDTCYRLEYFFVSIRSKVVLPPQYRLMKSNVSSTFEFVFRLIEKSGRTPLTFFACIVDEFEPFGVGKRSLEILVKNLIAKVLHVTLKQVTAIEDIGAL